MNEDTVKRLFKENVDTDADYLLIFYKEPILYKEVGPWTWNTVPRKEFSKEDGIVHWETIDEALIIIFIISNWDIVEVYDLYSPFESALIKTVTKDSFFN